MGNYRASRTKRRISKLIQEIGHLLRKVSGKLLPKEKLITLKNQKTVKEKDLKKLLNKLRRPVYIGYIGKYILNTDIQETKVIVDQLVKEGYIEEDPTFSGYYVVKNKQ
jgi:hypothetical protein